jgi:hypothetical protein
MFLTRAIGAYFGGRVAIGGRPPRQICVSFGHDGRAYDSDAKCNQQNRKNDRWGHEALPLNRRPNAN